MKQQEFLEDQGAVKKLQDLATEINICLFCSDTADDSETGCRPMATAGVDEEGTIWFLSDRNSEKNKEIQIDPQVTLYYSHPGKSIFMVVSGMASIEYDREKIRELWNPLDKAWFPEGEDDPDISLIKVRPLRAHFWDAKGGKMVNFIKMVASLATGKALVEGEEGNISLTPSMP